MCGLGDDVDHIANSVAYKIFTQTGLYSSQKKLLRKIFKGLAAWGGKFSQAGLYIGQKICCAKISRFGDLGPW